MVAQEFTRVLISENIDSDHMGKEDIQLTALGFSLNSCGRRTVAFR